MLNEGVTATALWPVANVVCRRADEGAAAAGAISRDPAQASQPSDIPSDRQQAGRGRRDPVTERTIIRQARLVPAG